MNYYRMDTQKTIPTLQIHQVHLGNHFYAKNKSAHAITKALAEDRYKWHNLDLESKQARYFGSPLENMIL